MGYFVLASRPLNVPLAGLAMSVLGRTTQLLFVSPKSNQKSRPNSAPRAPVVWLTTSPRTRRFGASDSSGCRRKLSARQQERRGAPQGPPGTTSAVDTETRKNTRTTRSLLIVIASVFVSGPKDEVSAATTACGPGGPCGSTRRSSCTHDNFLRRIALSEGPKRPSLQSGCDGYNCCPRAGARAEAFGYFSPGGKVTGRFPPEGTGVVRARADIGGS